MNDLFKTMIIVIISSFVTTLLLNLIYKRNPKNLSFIDKIPERWKGNWFIRWILILFFITIITVLVVLIGLNETTGTIIIGFFISFTEFIFRKPKRLN